MRGVPSISAHTFSLLRLELKKLATCSLSPPLSWFNFLMLNEFYPFQMEGYGFSDEEKESETGGEQLPSLSSVPCQSSVNSMPYAWSITSIFFPAPNPTHKAASVFLKNPKPTLSVRTPSPRAENSIVALTVTLGLERASHLPVTARDVYQSLLGSHPSPCGSPHQNLP